MILETDRDYDWYFLIYCDRVNKNRFVINLPNLISDKSVDINAKSLDFAPQNLIALATKCGGEKPDCEDY